MTLTSETTSFVLPSSQLAGEGGGTCLPLPTETTATPSSSSSFGSSYSTGSRCDLFRRLKADWAAAREATIMHEQDNRTFALCETEEDQENGT